MTIFAQNRATGFRLKRNVVVFTAVVADDFKSLRCICSACGILWATLRTSLRRRHIVLVKIFLFLLGKNKVFAALHARNFYVGHRLFLLFGLCGKFNRKILNVATISRNRLCHNLAYWVTVSCENTLDNNKLKLWNLQKVITPNHYQVCHAAF